MKTHFAVLVESSWKTLCGEPGESVRGTLVVESQITCPVCLTRWKAGMKRVARLFRDYQGEP